MTTPTFDQPEAYLSIIIFYFPTIGSLVDVQRDIMTKCLLISCVVCSVLFQLPLRIILIQLIKQVRMYHFMKIT